MWKMQESVLLQRGVSGKNCQQVNAKQKLMKTLISLHPFYVLDVKEFIGNLFNGAFMQGK